MIRPLVLDGIVQLNKTGIPAGRSAKFMALPAAVRADGDTTAQIHRNRRIPTRIPEFDPAIKRRPAPAMNQHHRWKFVIAAAGTGRLSRHAVVSKDASRLALVHRARIIKRFHTLDLHVVRREYFRWT